MTNIKVFSNNNTVRSFNFYNLLDGLVWVYENIEEFDYILIDDCDMIKKHNLLPYLKKVNTYCDNYCGYHYSRY